jgi:hypothetical protein
MFMLIASVLGVAVYGALIALFWKEVHPAIAATALQQYITPEALDQLQPEPLRPEQSDVNCNDSGGESKRDASESSMTIDATLPLVETHEV